MRRSNKGKGWETRLDFQHDEYRRERRGVFFHAHPEVKVIAGKAIRSKGPPDYFGVADGVAYLFDAKKVEGPRFALSNIKPHQAKALEAWMCHTGDSGVALKIGARTFWIPWEELNGLWWAWHEARGARASVDVAWLETHARDMGGGADWLAVAQ